MEPVLVELTNLIQSEPEIELLNFFRSYPISIKATLLSMDAVGTAIVRVSPPGSVCLYQNKTTILLSNSLADAVRAKILSFDILEGIVRLSGFSYIGPWTGRRMIIRVQPGQIIPVLLERDDLTVQGTATDISLNGIGVSVTNRIIKDETFQVKVTLPSGETSLPGTVLDITPIDGVNRLSIKFLSNSRDIAFILKYITNRRIEIQNEIDRLYEKVYNTAKA